jgi:hypothetical protein
VPTRRRAARLPGLRSTLTVVGILTALAVAGCTGDDGETPSPAPAPAAPSTTPLEGLDTTAMTVARGDFCSRVAPAAVEDALAGASPRARTWGNGDRVLLAPGVKDVAHEYGCAWHHAGATAEAWVFAPPVTPAQAGRFAAALAATKGCSTVPGAPRFGRRTTALSCARGTEVSLHGLFGDAWLSCSLSARNPEGLVARTTAWCATVAQAAATSPSA